MAVIIYIGSKMIKKVIISACLLGENCRYDGKAKVDNSILQKYKNYEIIPFCPEAPLFGTPRQRISIVQIDGKNRVITDETNEDVTQKLKDEINSFIAKFPDVKEIVLKSKSPSCGVGSTPILDENKIFLKYGSGIASEIFKQVYKDVKIKDELNYLE